MWNSLARGTVSCTGAFHGHGAQSHTCVQIHMRRYVYVAEGQRWKAHKKKIDADKRCDGAGMDGLPGRTWASPFLFCRVGRGEHMSCY